jgi:hypothetical protein
MNGLHFNFYYDQIRKEKEVNEHIPELTKEFDDIYIRSLASKEHAD